MIDTTINADVLNALRRRRSMSKVAPERPPKELVEHILDAGTWGPSHHKTRSWRFVVLGGDARDALGEVMAASLQGRIGEANTTAVDKERAKPLRAPVIIVVAVEPATGPKVLEVEEIESGAAAVENMLIAAEAVGLGAMWRTGPAAYDPAVKGFLNLPESAHIIAFVYVGFPELPEMPPRESDAPARTTWCGWEE